MDIPLNLEGKKQASNLISPLKKQNLDIIYSSDLSRAKETAQIISNSLKIPVKEIPGLREAHLGEAQGKTKEDIQALVSKTTLIRWKSNHPTDADISYPGGETGNEVKKRALDALLELVKSEDFMNAGIATHGGVIRRLMQVFLPENRARVPIPNGIVYRVEFCLTDFKWTFKNHINI